MYLPIPVGFSGSATETATLAKDACNSAKTSTVSVNHSIPISTVSLMKKENSLLEEVIRPEEGVWREIKKSKSIKMTPMSIKNERDDYFIAQVQVPTWKHNFAQVGQDRAKPLGSSTCSNCKQMVVSAKLVKVSGRYVEQGDLDYWKSKYPDAPHYAGCLTYLDENKIEAAKASTYAELMQAYNLGEEIAEIRESIMGIRGLFSDAIDLILHSREKIDSLLRTYRRFNGKGKIAKKSADEAASRWMEFRYGIMPIIFSICDILLLEQSEGKYLTVRNKVGPEIEINEVPDPVDRPAVYFQDIEQVELRCSITAKARWASSEIRKFDLINLNPLTTLTAVLPWSMVVRWFFNVQSYLDCQVKSLTSLALEQHACVAVREKRELSTYLYYSSSYRYDFRQASFWSANCGNDYFGPVDLGLHTDSVSTNVLLRKMTKDNYTRYLFQPSDVKLVYSPHVTWQRGVDGLILGVGTLSRLLRRLK